MSRRPGKPLARRGGNRPQKQRFLLYCEGKVTEPTYFNGLRGELRSRGVTIKLGNSSGEPMRLVEAAIAHQRRAPLQREDDYPKYDYVWCVFDVEAPRPHPSLEKALQRAKGAGVRCAVSNPCFELWLLLHFADQTGYVTTADACRRLEKHPCDYAQAEKSFTYEAVRDLRPNAMKRAQKLEKEIVEDTPVGERNPWTSVWQLVRDLRKYA